MGHSSLRTALKELLNRESAENGSDTPDFILATYLMDCLSAFNRMVRAREVWYGRQVGNGRAIRSMTGGSWKPDVPSSHEPELPDSATGPTGALPAPDTAWAAPCADPAELRAVGAMLGGSVDVEPDGSSGADHRPVSCSVCGALVLPENDDLHTGSHVMEDDMFRNHIMRLERLEAELQRALRLIGAEVDSQHATDTTPKAGANG